MSNWIVVKTVIRIIHSIWEFVNRGQIIAAMYLCCRMTVQNDFKAPGYRMMSISIVVELIGVLAYTQYGCSGNELWDSKEYGNPGRFA
jgi:hypothetical protein